jgi:hypothetical protein
VNLAVEGWDRLRKHEPERGGGDRESRVDEAGCVLALGAILLPSWHVRGTRMCEASHTPDVKFTRERALTVVRGDRLRLSVGDRGVHRRVRQRRDQQCREVR